MGVVLLGNSTKRRGEPAAMEISFRLLLNELGFDAEVGLAPGENPRFTSVELFSQRGADLSGRKLLVCTLSEALSLPRREGLCLLCARDETPEPPRVPDGVALVRKRMDLRELFNHAQRAFVRLLDWMMAMEGSIARNGGLQELITLSEPLFKNHISVLDSTFKLLAHTRGIEGPDHVTRELVSHGYHPPETMQLFKELRRIEEFEHNQNIVVSDDHQTSQYTVVKKMFHCSGTVSILVVMVCCGREATEGLLELFRILLDYVQVYVERDFLANSDSSAKKSLARDLIMQSVSSPEEARIRAMYAGLPFEEQFCLSVLVFLDEDNVPLSQLVHAYSDALPDSVVFSDERHILILDIGGAGPGPDWERTIERLAEKQDFRCGISDAFTSLPGINVAYEQAILAVKTADRLRAVREKSKGGGGFYAFRDYWVYHMLASGAQAAPAAYKSSFYFRALDTLRQHDAEHNTDDLGLLRLYLECDRKATAVSARLHMHRNTVIYRIDRVESLLGLSLEDPETRLRLLLAYKTEDFEANSLFFSH